MNVPSYRHHKASGRAMVEIHGKPIYLGKYDSEESRRKYREVIATYIATGDAPPLRNAPPPTVQEAAERFRLARLPELTNRDRKHLEPVLADLTAIYGHLPAEEFGPVKYEAVRQLFVQRGWSRQYVNAQASRLKQVLRWFVARELYPPAKLDAIRAVPNLRAGQTSAPERPRRRAANLADILKTLPHLPHPVRGIVLFQLHTGCRPSEAIAARREEIDTTGKAELPDGTTKQLDGLWLYTPTKHKGSHRDADRYICIGPQGQAALTEYLPESGYLFRPADVAKAPRPGERYRIDSYNRAIAKGRAKAGVAPWTAYQIRHWFAGQVRDHFGIEHVKEALGHSHVSMSEWYASIGLEKAAEAARKVG